MPDLSLDLRYLNHAIRVADLGSFRKAAESMNLSQSTVSRRVQLLERRLGVKLFDRDRKGVTLTVVGERFIRSAAVGADHIRQAILNTRQAKQGMVGELRIGVLTSIGNGILGDLLESYRSAFPKVDICLEELPWQSSGITLSGKGPDVAFIVSRMDAADCNRNNLWSERIVVALPRSHSLAEKPKLSWSELGNEVFLFPASAIEAEIEAFLIRRIAHERRPDIAYHKVGLNNLLGLVARKFGVFLTLESTAIAGLEDVVFIPVGDERDTVQVSSVWSTDDRNPVVAPFIRFAEAHLRYRS